MCERRVDLLVCSLPLHRHSYIGFILAFASSFHNKQQGHHTDTHIQVLIAFASSIHNNKNSVSCLRAAFSQQLKGKVDLALAKTVTLRINLNLDGVPIASKAHTHPSHSETSRLLTSSLSRQLYVLRLI